MRLIAYKFRLHVHTEFVYFMPNYNFCELISVTMVNYPRFLFDYCIKKIQII